MKRKTLVVQREIHKMIKKNPGISMSELERKIGTNPRSLKEHCQQLAYFHLITIRKEDNTQRLITAK